jgi:DNA repair protein RadC
MGAIQELIQEGGVKEDEVLLAAEKILVARRRKKPLFREPRETARYVRANAHCLDQECFYVLTLNQKNQLIKMHLISKGTVNEASVHPRDVFRVAILDNSAGIILSHNHPSGDANPSSSDFAYTKRLKECAEILGIRIIDHIIIGDGEFYSFNDKGTL